MTHLGDIKKINGRNVPAVDVVIGGSPCQDLSAAGKRTGLAGARSGLFMEQIRVIKEMRDVDIRRGRAGNAVRPRFMVWENVPGAFSSNGGEDFRIVLEETARIADKSAAVPRPPKGKWRNAGCIMGDGWSIAWRVLDAQFWGVPQRRRRIALIADFGGESAPEILFVRKSVCGDIKEGGTQREETAKGTGNSTYPPIARSLTARYDSSPCIDRGANIVYQAKDTNGVIPINTMAATRGGADDMRMCFGIGEPGDPQFTVSAAHCHAVFQKSKIGQIYDTRGNGDGKTSCTLTRDNANRMTDYMPIAMRQVAFGEYKEGVGTMTAGMHTAKTGETLIVSGLDCQNGTEKGDLCGTLQAKQKGGYILNCRHPVRIGACVRRLTPLECERLQGYPDGWTDIGAWKDSKGKLHKESSDAVRYKALGNSIALPPWSFVLKRLCACCERPATMASLFDGIGGFPLIWERLNGTGTCLWASEIEEFPMAVTRRRFCK